MENSKLIHSGIKGMRWGIRRYQNKDGSLTPAGRKRYGEQQSEELDSQTKEELKKRAINSGDINTVAKYRSNMTNDEFRRALDRVDLEQRMSRANSSINKSGFEKTMDVADKIDRVRNAGEKTLGMYSLAAKINNTFNQKFKMPEVDSRTKSVVDAYKDSLINTASAKEVWKNIDKLNAQEIQTVKTRLENEESIKTKASKP